jgi:hypothetical protein
MQPKNLSPASRQFALVAITILACLCAPAAQAEPPKPKDGPLGTMFVPLPKGTFYMGWDSDKNPPRYRFNSVGFRLARVPLKEDGK